MTQFPAPVAASSFNFRAVLRPGDWIVCGQTAAEPLTLTRKLLAEVDAAMPLQMFFGAMMSSTFDGPMPAGMRFLSYGAMGRSAALADRGLLDVLTESYGALPALFASGVLQADVVLLQLSPAQDGRPPSCGLANDYTLAAARKARVVIAEVNPDVPWTYGAELPADVRIDHWVAAECGPLELAPPMAGPIESAIARHVASLIPDGATLQTGIGSLPDAALLQLRQHRALGFHSGVFSDAAASLLQSGAITNAHKGIDTGISVTNTVYGSAWLYRQVALNPAIEVRPTSYTHAAAVLAQLHRLHAVNGALQVDLSGQVNCESVGGKQRGGVGGLLDFSRAARASQGGRAITILPATAANGAQSRIVADLAGNPATVGRSDVDTVVTEFGIAELRNATLAQRAERLIAIAAPPFRDALRHTWRTSTWGRKAWH